MSGPEAEAGGGATVDRYVCNACGRRFAGRPGFEGRHYT